MKTCPPADHLSGLLDGRLDPRTTTEVSDHLERCRTCRSRIEELSSEPDSRRWAELRADTTSFYGPEPTFLGRLQNAGQKRSSRGGTSIGRVAGGPDGPTIPTGHTAPPGYEILGYLGRGGMGVVYKARQLALKRIVALKMLRPEAVAEADQRARLIGEAETIARLHHPNIAQVFEVGEHDGAPYLALEYIEGPTLAQVLDGKPNPPRVAARLVATLARAAHHGHTLGVVHRDLKPGNILLGNDERGRMKDESKTGPGLNSSFTLQNSSFTPKITDFGLAKRLDEIGQTQTGQVLGTPCYMAPEQARGASSEITPLADVYALGAILYELLTGRPPLVGLTTLDTVIRVLNEDPARPRVVTPGIPADLETVCLKCLEKDPRRRYASAAALADDLDRFLAGTAVLARPLSRPVRAWRWARRHPTAAALLAVMLAVAAVGFPAATALWLDARQAGSRARDAEDEAVRARTAIARQSAGLLADRGFALAEAADVGPGLLWLAEALRVCPAETEDDEALRGVIRANLAAYAALLPRPIAVLETGDVSCAGFSADGRRVATGHHDGAVRVWDAATGAAVAGPFRHDHAVTDLAFHPDGRTLLVGYGGLPGTREADGNCWRWDLATGQRLGEPFRLGGAIRVVAWSPDGRLVAVGGGQEVAVWEAETMRPVSGPWRTELPGLGGSGYEITRVRFTPHGRAVAVSLGRVYADGGWKGVGAYHLIDVADGRTTSAARFPTGRPEKLVVSPDGRFLATGDDWDTTVVQRLDPATRAPVGGPVQFTGGFASLTPDGGTVLLAHDDRSVRFTDVRAGRPGPALRSAWTNRIVELDPAGGVFLKDTELWAMPRPLSRPAPADPDTKFPIAGVAVSPDAETLMNTGYDRVLYFTQTADGLPARQPVPGCAGRIVLSPDGTRLAVTMQVGPKSQTEAPYRVFDLSRGVSETARLRHPALRGGAAFSPDNRWLAVGTYGRVVHLFDLGTRTARKPVPIRDIVLGVAYSPDGRHLAVGRANDWTKAPHVQFLDPATGALDGDPLPHVEERVWGVAFNRDGSRLFATSNARVRLWDVAAREPVGPTVSVAGRLPGTPFSPDGRWLVCLEAKTEVRVRAADTGAGVGPPVGGPANITAAAFSPDSRSLLLGHADGTARVYDRATMRPLGPAVAQRHGLRSVAWAPDGRSFVTVSAAGVPRRWPVGGGHADDPDALTAAVEVLTAARMDAGPAVVPLDRDEWLARYRAFLDRHESLDRVLGPVLPAADWHDARARDAEEEGDAPTALYHLDRRLAAVPGDGAAALRRMHQYVLMEKRVAAEADRRRAIELLGPEVVATWHRHVESMCEARKLKAVVDWVTSWGRNFESICEARRQKEAGDWYAGWRE